ncbi:hypothetical protein [Mycolicibacterium sp. 120270]|uniref:hypothetical protein n=1 Tax=Mycolicibacterium sp. 120270 TaxID=3090600 RepID=UPI00299D2832|nr:hypothetical protein [Mycolicibacterium sp. 120270]MDX1885216.1 hypothetical protein [Mycolicibacterium sp. 120270]
MIKVNTLGLIFAAMRLQSAANSLTTLTNAAFAQPLAADGTSAGAAARLDAASTALMASTAAHIASLNEAALHLMLIAAKFATQEEINKANLAYLHMQATALDDTTLATLSPCPPLAPDVRIPIPVVPTVAGEVFAQQIHNGSASRAEAFNTAATKAGSAADEVATTIRSVAAAVPDYWESPIGTAALAGRLNEHVAALNTISERWFTLAEQSRRHGDDYSETTGATPKPTEFTEARDRLNQAIAAKNPVAASQASTDLGRLEAKAAAEALRYAGITEATTGFGTPDAPAAPNAPGAPGSPTPIGTGAPGQAPAAVASQGEQLTKSGAAEAAQAAKAPGADQLAQMLPQALQSIGGMAGGLAGMAGQVPQQLMQAGQGLAQTASGLMGKGATDPELTKKASGLKSDELSKEAGAGAGGGGGGGGIGDTHPAGALGPPVTPSTSHTVPTLPSGAPAPPPTTPTASGGTAMGAMPMGMPMGAMGGLAGHGQGGDGADKVPNDKKVVTPPQPHTEAVTGRVPDRTAAAAEASRTRAESESGSDSDDDPPPRGPIMRRITLAPLNDERS